MQGKPKILCVDDEPVNLKLLHTFLTPKGYEVIPAEGGKEAIRIIQDQWIDIVLLDVMMPEVNGFEVCKWIKSSDMYRNIPVVMITALASKEHRIRGIEAGAEDFISKPIDQGEVLARIKMLLRMRDLNDRVTRGYTNLNRLISAGEDVINKFSPLHFDFMGTIDHIVSQIIRQAGDEEDKPRIVLVGYLDEGKKWKWYQYESAFQELLRTPLESNIQQVLNFPQRGDSKIAYYNEEDLKKIGFQTFIKKVESIIPIKMTNFICYISSEFSIFAINYSFEVTSYDTSVLKSIVMQSVFLKSLADQIKETENAFAYTVHSLVRACQANDEETGYHVTRVGEYCAVIARKLKMIESFQRRIRLQALMHDVGMIYIPARIIKKPGTLTPEEWKIVKNHPLFGVKILGNHPRLAMAKNIALAHHEKWDGSGYPYGLAGEKIPVEARIASIADHYDTLRCARPYKPSYDHGTACRIIGEGNERVKPAHFDPRVFQAFKEVAPQFEEIFERWKDGLDRFK
jgi:response regulator RpfG family c-di-GMP phosphodiesterase